MGVFDLFIETETGISAWIKWIHSTVPDEEGEDREKIRKRLSVEKHCETCTVLSGCYFVSNRMPGHLPPDMLHAHCDCSFAFVDENSVKKQIKAFCDVRKFNEYLFTEEQIKNGKAQPYFDLGFDIHDSEYLAVEYARQAQEKYMRGEYKLQKLDKRGQRINIELEIKNNNTMTIISGWMVHPLGYISAATPFVGYGERII